MTNKGWFDNRDYGGGAGSFETIEELSEECDRRKDKWRIM